jgi:hypothetical protein
MMGKNKQAESIKEKREEDAQLLRKSYLAVIDKYLIDGQVNGTAQEVKAFIEACKGLARLQHLLQPDKITEKEPPKQEKPFSPDREKEIDTRVDDILARNKQWIQASEIF